MVDARFCNATNSYSSLHHLRVCWSNGWCWCLCKCVSVCVILTIQVDAIFVVHTVGGWPSICRNHCLAFCRQARHRRRCHRGHIDYQVVMMTRWINTCTYFNAESVETFLASFSRISQHSSSLDYFVAVKSPFLSSKLLVLKILLCFFLWAFFTSSFTFTWSVCL